MKIVTRLVLLGLWIAPLALGLWLTALGLFWPSATFSLNYLFGGATIALVGLYGLWKDLLAELFGRSYDLHW